MQWADVIRKSFDENAVDEIISTRRLVHIAKAYTIFGDRMKAIELCDRDSERAAMEDNLKLLQERKPVRTNRSNN